VFETANWEGIRKTPWKYEKSHKLSNWKAVLEILCCVPQGAWSSLLQYSQALGYPAKDSITWEEAMKIYKQRIVQSFAHIEGMWVREFRLLRNRTTNFNRSI
jgi:hypothetical protein